MLSAGTWNGGYVDNDGNILYYNSDGMHDNDGDEGCGCACGEACGCDSGEGCDCGSGEGCGCGYGLILAGVGTVIIRGVDIDFTWDDGSLKDGVNVSIMPIDANGVVSCEWKGNYKITFSLTMTGSTDTIDFFIPEVYRL